MATKNLWAPWRLSYLQNISSYQQQEAQNDDCIFCEACEAKDDDTQEEKLILINDDRGLLLLNRYPYTNGHLLAAPPVHIFDLSGLSSKQRSNLMELTEIGSRLLKEATGAQGVNIGMNIGSCAGAGLPGHAHMHIVPRWHGDVNFMSVIGQVRVIPSALEDSYAQLKQAIEKM